LCATENEKSCAVPERLGFRREGIERQAEWLYDHFVDHAVYSALASEWPTRRS
jgi:ribosomal-protein-serine acetyltransferase